MFLLASTVISINIASINHSKLGLETYLQKLVCFTTARTQFDDAITSYSLVQKAPLNDGWCW